MIRLIAKICLRLPIRIGRIKIGGRIRGIRPRRRRGRKNHPKGILPEMTQILTLTKTHPRLLQGGRKTKGTETTPSAKERTRSGKGTTRGTEGRRTRETRTKTGTKARR